MINNLDEYINQIKKIDSIEDYHVFIHNFNTQLEKEKISPKIIKKNFT